MLHYMVQLRYYYCDINHSVSITGSYIYDTNYKRAFPLMKESLDIIFSPPKDKKNIYAEFQDVFYTVLYMKTH